MQEFTQSPFPLHFNDYFRPKADILNRIKSEFAPEMATSLEAGIQRHLNRVLANVEKSSRITENDIKWLP